MYLKIFEALFCASAFVLSILLILRELGITKKMSPMRASDYVSGIAAVLVLYIIFVIALVILIPKIGYKAIMLLFGLSPFIIGKLVTYEKVKIYSIIQIFTIFVSIIFVLLI